MKPLQHGTLSGYIVHKCRCDDCKRVKSRSDREYRDRKGRKPKGNPCTIDGVTYPSQSEAARQLGISTSCISYHLNRHGGFSRFRKPAGGRNGGLKKPVTIGNRTWPSQMALARYLGISEECLRWWTKQNHAEKIMVALLAADAKQKRAA